MINAQSTPSDRIALPLLGYGTYELSEEDAPKCIALALQLGYRHIDCASSYKNETAIGIALKESKVPRNELFITSKVWPGRAGWGETECGRDAIFEAYNKSLKKLQIDSLDLYLIHAPVSNKEARLEQWRALIELKEKGLVKHIGVSNYGVNHLQEIEKAGLEMPTVNQIELHPLCQQRNTIRYMKEKNILPVVYSSLAPLPSWRGKTEGNTKDERIVHDAALASISEKYGVTQAQVLLRWALQHGFPILPKSANEERIRQNADLFQFEIDSSDMATIDSWESNDAFSWKFAGVKDPMHFE